MPSLQTVNKASCLVLVMGAAGLVVWWWGWSIWTLILVAVMLSCPVVLLYLWHVSRRTEATVHSAAGRLHHGANANRRSGSEASGGHHE